MYTVYLLYSPSHDKFYVGQTQDLEQRLRTHNELSDRSYTSKYRPWELKAQLSVPTRAVAMLLERHIKAKKRRAYLEAIITDKDFRQRLITEFSETDDSVG